MKERLDLEIFTMNFYRGDITRLRKIYPDRQVSIIIRNVIRDYINRVEDRAKSRLDQLEVVDEHDS